jgi:pimeloyl-ACP methyl ester carboxylesterase
VRDDRPGQRFLDVRGNALHVVDMGTDAEGPPLVLVHGFTGSDVDWLDVQGPLADAGRRRVVSYTHRGHGLSGHDEPYTLAEMVADLEVVVDELGLAPMHLLGHSMGGAVALRYALAHPDHLASLVLMDTSAGAFGGLGSWTDQLAPAVEAQGMAPIVELMQRFAANLRPEIAERVEHKVSRMDPKAFLGFARALQSAEPLVDRLGELAVPGRTVTVLVGENDGPLVDAARVLHEGIPGSHLEVVADAGHSPQEDQPEAWLAALERHLRPSN